MSLGVASTKAYTSQFLSLVMFGVMMAEDRISKQERVNEIISCLKTFPGEIDFDLKIVVKYFIVTSTIGNFLYCIAALFLIVRTL